MLGEGTHQKLLGTVLWIKFLSLDYILPYKLARNLRYEGYCLPVDSDLRIYGYVSFCIILVLET